MTRVHLFALLLLVCLAACTHRVPTATFVLVDTSLSITPRAESEVMNALRGQMQRMERGDRLILIPVTGNAANDAGGRILRLVVPTTREVYDADLRRFRDDAAKQLAAWATMRGAEPNRTDLLGSLDAARQEFASLPAGYTRRLVILSDFIEDDDEYRFLTDPALASPTRARALASRLRSARAFHAPGASVCLGRLESVDIAKLPSLRRESIDSFWKAYLEDHGREPDIQIDGPRIITNANSACFKTLSASSKTGESVR